MANLKIGGSLCFRGPYMVYQIWNYKDQLGLFCILLSIFLEKVWILVIFTVVDAGQHHVKIVWKFFYNFLIKPIYYYECTKFWLFKTIFCDFRQIFTFSEPLIWANYPYYFVSEKPIFPFILVARFTSYVSSNLLYRYVL